MNSVLEQVLSRLETSAKPKLTPEQTQELTKALEAIAVWLNTTQKKAGTTPVVPALKTVVDLFGYVPWNKSVYRVFTTTQRFKIGQTVKMATGWQTIQSWAETEDAARSFRKYLGNSKDVILVQLLSGGKELMNTRWLRSLLPKIEPSTPRLKHALKNLQVILRPGPDDEKEVLMQMPTQSRVKILYVFEKYKPNGH